MYQKNYLDCVWKEGESVDDYAQEFESLFEESYGRRVDIDVASKGVLKWDIFVPTSVKG